MLIHEKKRRQKGKQKHVSSLSYGKGSEASQKIKEGYASEDKLRGSTCSKMEDKVVVEDTREKSNILPVQHMQTCLKHPARMKLVRQNMAFPFFLEKEDIGRSFRGRFYEGEKLSRLLMKQKIQLSSI